MKAFGSISGKNNRKLFKLNKKRKKIKTINEEEKRKHLIEEEQKEKKKKEIEINSFLKAIESNKKVNSDNISNPKSKNVEILSEPTKKRLSIFRKKTTESIDHPVEIKVAENKDLNDQSQKAIINIPHHHQHKQNTNSVPKKVAVTDSQHSKNADTNNITEYLKMEITYILEQDIRENIFQLKKIDSDFYNIEKKVEYINDDDDLKELEIEIRHILEQLEYIKRQITSLEKTFNFKYPIEEPDNYLVFLVDEYKNRIKSQKDFSKNLEHNLEYKSIIAKMIDLEDKKNNILEKIESKKNQLQFENEQIEEMKDDLIPIEQIANSIKNLVAKQELALIEIRKQVDKSVNITERVKYVTKNVNNSFMELFLLMSLFQRNLNKNNNIIALTETSIILDLIYKMCTPSTEKIIIKESDVVDYQNMINNCLNDTNKLASMINNSLTTISSIRYTFLNDYKDCSYLPAYQETIKNLDMLEDDIKTRSDEIKRMNKEIELQLEKNNAKVKKYGSII